MASAYGQRPSAILGIEDEWAAYQLDLATLRLGRQVEKELAEGKSIEEAFTPGPSPVHQNDGRGGGRFKEPVAAKKMRIPDGGVW